MSEIDIKNFVDVTIIANTRPLQIDRFNSFIFIGHSNRFEERVRQYRSTSAMIQDGFRDTDPEYIAAVSALQQTPSVSKIYIGRRAATAVTLTAAADAIAGDTYSFALTIDGTSLDVIPSISVDDTPTEIVAAVKTAIAALAAPHSALTLTGTTDLTISGTFAIGQVDPKYTQVNTNSETYATAVSEIRKENDDWYGLTVETKDTAIQLTIPAIASVNNKFAGLSSSHADNKAALVNGTTATSSDDLLGQAFEQKLETIAIYSTDEVYPECGVFSKMLSSERYIFNNWAFKSYVGIASENITQTEYDNILSKSGNVIVQVKGVNVFQNGKASSGEWVNVLIGIQILEARVQEELYNLQLTNDILTFSNADLQLVQASIESVLTRYTPVFILARRGVLDNAGQTQFEPGFTVNVPKRSQLSSVDISNRELNDVTFTAYLAGAINFIGIQGTVQY